MIIFESRITKHVGIVSLSTLRLWGLDFDFNSEANQKILEGRVSKLKESPSSHTNSNGVKSLMMYFYKPEAYFHPTYRKSLAQHILDLSNLGFEVTLESDSVHFINYFGDQIECGLVSKDDFKVRIETEKDGSPYFLDLEYDDNGVLNGKGGEPYPIGYFN
jgi:hypothetical protein